MHNHGMGQLLNHFIGYNVTGTMNSQASSAEFVDQGQHTDLSPMEVPNQYKVTAPYMIPRLRTKAQTASVVKPQASSWGLFVPNLETLFLPDPPAPVFRGLLPTGVPHEPVRSSVAIAPVGTGKPDDFSTERYFIITRLRLITPSCSG